MLLQCENGIESPNSRTNSSEQAFNTLVLPDHFDSMEYTSVEPGRVSSRLEFPLQLQSSSTVNPTPGFGESVVGKNRILTTSNGCVTVTAPHAAIPPATKALGERVRNGQEESRWNQPGSGGHVVNPVRGKHCGSWVDMRLYVGEE